MSFLWNLSAVKTSDLALGMGSFSVLGGDVVERNMEMNINLEMTTSK